MFCMCKMITWFVVTMCLICLVVGNDVTEATLNPWNRMERKSINNSVSLHSEPTTATTHESGSGERYHIAVVDWENVQAPYIVVLWILLAMIAKICFNFSPKMSSVFPDSSLLIILGLIVGVILFFIQTDQNKFQLQNKIFFLFLLPPIVFDAGYFMPNRAFFDNLGTILIYAVFGTLWNTITIGLSLWAIGLTGIFAWPTPLLHILIFSSLISAVDPVAVLVVFEEIHVNAILYIVVFGESLLNDAVTVVLYEMFEAFAEIGGDNLQAVDFISGFIAFFVVSLGGVAIGVIFALVCSFLTKFTKRVRVIEPMLIYIMAYLSYLTAEMFHLSAILAIVFCGITMRQYVEENISQKSKTTVQYFMKMISSSCETIIFMFLGTSTVSNDHGWDTAFVALTVLFCLVFRALGVVILTYFVNKQRLIKLNKVDQFVMAYGGLRGAIAYGLVIALDPVHIGAKKMFVTTTVVVIYFTVFLQGMTIKPLVNFLKVKKEEHHDASMCEEIFGRNIDHLVSAVETMAGLKGHHWRRNRFDYINFKYLKPILLRERHVHQENTIMKTFTEINIKAAVDHVEKFGSFYGDITTIPKTNSTSDLTTSTSQTTPRDQSCSINAFNNPAYVSDEDDATHQLFLSSLVNSDDIKPYNRDIVDDISETQARRRSLPGANHGRAYRTKSDIPASNSHHLTVPEEKSISKNRSQSVKVPYFKPLAVDELAKLQTLDKVVEVDTEQIETSLNNFDNDKEREGKVSFHL